MPIIAAIFFMLGLGAAAGPDPAPYQEVKARADWASPAGRALAFCVLGRAGEPRGRALAVYEKKGAGWARLFLDRERGFNPWAISLCELDGDSLPEVAVGVWKSARYDPAVKNRLFIFDWTENDVLFPKWLGSRLGLPFLDFGFARAPDGLDRLLTLEHSGEERLVLRQYHWNGFGFSHDRDLDRVTNPENFERSSEDLAQKMRDLEKKGIEP